VANIIVILEEFPKQKEINLKEKAAFDFFIKELSNLRF